MNKLLIFSFLLASTLAFGQKNNEENGRPAGAKPSFAVASSEEVYLKKGAIATSSEVKLEYALPKGQNSGKIILFNPKKDEELKSYSLNDATGVISINLKELTYSEFSAGLYDSAGKHLKSLNVYN